MLSALLARTSTSDAGTFGVLLFDTGWTRHTLELPWRGNLDNFSCIPCGAYLCEIRESAKWKGPIYELKDVPGRDNIQIHPGNWAGDIKKALKSNVEGCVLLGRGRQVAEGQPALRDSRIAIDDLYDLTKREPFMLTVSKGLCDESFTVG